MSNKQQQQDNDSDYQSMDSQQQPTISQQIQDAIRQLPTLEQKIHAIAINHYIIQKRQLQDKQDNDIRMIQFKGRKLCDVHIDEINNIIEDKISVAEIQIIMDENKELLNDKQIEQIGQMVKKNQGIEACHGYWLKCMLNSDIIAQQIHETDKKVLQHLYRISSTRSEDSKTLHVSFHFTPNKWFHNQKLTKQFQLNKEQPISSTGQQIQWKQGMNYTVTKIQQKKKKGKKQEKQQIIKQPSFFHFFDSIDTDQDRNKNIKDEEEFEELMEDLELQYQLSTHIYEDLIPKSLQFYLKCQSGDDKGHDDGKEKGEDVKVVREKQGDNEEEQQEEK